MASVVPGNNVPPVSFPGIASGIDYNSIITKLTSLTLAPNAQLNAQISTLNAANQELITINGLLASVQGSLNAISDASLFSVYDATSSNLNAATANGISGQAATPGTYIVQSDTVATSTQVQSSASVGHSVRDNITTGPFAGQASDTVPLEDSFAAVTPANGTSGQGKVTVDGVTVNYDVTSQSLQTILGNIQTAVRASADASFTIGYQGATDTITVSGSQPITLGSAADQGNLLTVLKLDQAQINNGGPSYGVTGTSGVGGIDLTAALNNNNAGNFNTPVTGGIFTINGVAIAINPTQDNLASVLTRINASTAGVIANYDSSTNTITLTNKATGPQSIVLGASGDSSNFLSAVGLTTASGAATTVGSQAVAVVTGPTGITKTYYSNSNQITNAIGGISLNLLSNTSASPFTVTVAQDTSGLINAINTFASAYNAAIQEINTATAPPVVPSVGSGGLSNSAVTPLGGGVLYNSSDVGSVKNALTNLVSGFMGSGTSYNSLSQIGLTLSDSFSQLTTGNNGTQDTSGNGTQPVQTTTLQGTDGTLQALDLTKFQAALAKDPNAVSALLGSATGLATKLGSYLTSVTGQPTLISSGIVGEIPPISTIQGFENSNTDQISSLQQQVATITDQANSQADLLRSQFTASEGQIAVYQSLQQQLAGFFKGA
jgi:flagellar hook-associated protein 2